MISKKHTPLLIIIIDEDKSTFVYQSGRKVIYSNQIAVGTKAFANAVTEFFLKDYDLLIGELTARTVWMKLGNLPPRENRTPMLIRCRSSSSHELHEISVTSEQIFRAISKHTAQIIGETQTIGEQMIKNYPIARNELSILLRGNNGKLAGLAELISEKTSFSVMSQ